jgi:hypothetical protein
MNGHSSSGGARGRDGQALIEMTVALVAILAILAALLQIGLLSRVHLDTIGEARGNAAQYAISDVYQSMQPSAEMIQAWSEGDDTRRYSRDDEAALGSSQFLRQHVLPVAHPDELHRRVPGNRFFSLQYNDPAVEEFEFVRGTSESRPVPLLPVVRHLLYNAESIHLEAQSVSVWTKGID